MTPKEHRKKWKRTALLAYGRRCFCCAENRLAFLTIDHIEGGGTKHRKEGKIPNIYLWLIQNHFPRGFQVACFNCNLGRRLNEDICPHVKENV